MAVALRAGAAGVTVPSPGTQQPVTLPSGAQAGDLIQVYCASVAASNSFSCPGFNSVPPVSGAGGGTSQLLYKINLGDPPGTTYLVSSSFADVWGAVIVADGNSDQVIVFDGGASSGAISVADQTLIPNALTTAYPQDRLNWFGFTLLPSGTAQVLQPPGFTVEVPVVTSTLAAPNQNIALLFADYSPPRAAPPVPFVCGSLNALAGAGTYSFTVSASTANGDNLIVAVSSTAGPGALTGVTDSQNQNWQPLATVGSLAVWQCQATSPLTAGTDVITLSFSTTAGNVNALMTDDPGSLLLDVQVATSGVTGTSASQATGTLHVANERIQAFTWVNPGYASLTGWSAPFTGFGTVLNDTVNSGALAGAYDLVSATSSVTATYAWAGSQPWAQIVLTFRPWSIQPGWTSLPAINGAVLLGVPPGQPAPVFRPHHTNRRRYAPRPRRAVARVPVQATGTQFPIVIQARRRPVAVPRVTRARQAFVPVPPQGPQSRPFPAVFRQTRRAGTDGQAGGARVRRRRIFSPPVFPQGPLPPRWQPPAPVQRAARRFGPKLRRGRIVMPVPRQQAQGAPWLTSIRARRRKLENVRVYRKRVLAPPWGQGPQATGTPPVMTPVRRTRQRPWWYFRRPKRAQYLIPKATQQAAAHLSAPAFLHATATRGAAATATWRAPSGLLVTGTLIRAGTAALAQPSRLTVQVLVTKASTAHLTAASTMSAIAVLSRVASAHLQAASTLTAAGVTSSSAFLVQQSRLTVSARASQLATARLQAPSTLQAAATAFTPPSLIIIEPLTVPGVNAPDTTTEWVPEPVTESTVEAEPEPGLYDDSTEGGDS